MMCIFVFFSMTELRAAIIQLFEQGNSDEKIGKMLDLPARTAREVIKRFKETGSYEDRLRSGRPRTARTSVNKRKIKGRIQRNPNSRKNSTRKMAKAIGISEGSVRNILHKDLEMSARKLVEAHGLTENGKEKWLIRWKRSLFLCFSNACCCIHFQKSSSQHIGKDFLRTLYNTD